MNKIVSFKKEIPFSNLFEITSISLEHTYELENNNVVGDFIVSGEYRNFSTSINTIEFNKRIPFSIEIFDKYDITNLTVDIDDFNYEIVDNKILMVNIDLILDNMEEKMVTEEKFYIEDDEELRKTDILNDNEVSHTEIEDNVFVEDNDVINVDNSVNIDFDNTNQINSLFSNINTEETYKTYKIYIARENDTLESIMDKYQISKEKLELYNNINDIKLNDKIIIPND